MVQAREDVHRHKEKHHCTGISPKRNVTRQELSSATGIWRKNMLKQWLREVPANGSFVLSLEGGGQEGESIPCHWRAA